MSSHEKSYEDQSLPATLRYAGRLVRCPTLQEAVIAWNHLSPAQKKIATIKVESGRLYWGDIVDRLHHLSKSPA
jgi:hypothetical protein